MGVRGGKLGDGRWNQDVCLSYRGELIYNTGGTYRGQVLASSTGLCLFSASHLILHDNLLLSKGKNHAINSSIGNAKPSSYDSSTPKKSNAAESQC